MLHLVTLGAQLRERGVGLRVLERGVDTSTAEGRTMFGMLSVLAELQRELIVASTREGMAIAKERGRLKGKQPKLTTRQQAELVRLHSSGEYTIAELMEVFSVGRATVYRVLHRAKQKTAQAQEGT
jgi:DNA invertase Pin-like site-specific DNA recombinase